MECIPKRKRMLGALVQYVAKDITMATFTWLQLQQARLSSCWGWAVGTRRRCEVLQEYFNSPEEDDLEDLDDLDEDPALLEDSLTITLEGTEHY